jgi:hypothetical protein
VDTVSFLALETCAYKSHSLSLPYLVTLGTTFFEGVNAEAALKLNKRATSDFKGAMVKEVCCYCCLAATAKGMWRFIMLQPYLTVQEAADP